MRKSVFYTLILFILALNFQNIGHAFDLDETVDDEIRKNYNPDKLVNDAGIKAATSKKSYEEELPELPNITKQSSQSTKKDVSAKVNTPTQLPNIVRSVRNTKLDKGTSFEVISNNALSDTQQTGSKIKFTTQKSVSSKKYTIPAGTQFWGEIIEVHQPQITCNGGLVAIRIYAMNYNGETIPINGYLTRANDKKVFFNNIKGKRTYLQTMYKKGNWGRTMFGRMLTMTINLGGSGSTILLSPFPLAYGTICLGVNTLISPITAFFSKGGHVSIPSGSKFKIKLSEDIYV